MKNQWKRWLYALVVAYIGKRVLGLVVRFAGIAAVVALIVYVVWFFFKQS